MDCVHVCVVSVAVLAQSHAGEARIGDLAGRPLLVAAGVLVAQQCNHRPGTW